MLEHTPMTLITMYNLKDFTEYLVNSGAFFATKMT